MGFGSVDKAEMGRHSGIRLWDHKWENLENKMQVKYDEADTKFYDNFHYTLRSFSTYHQQLISFKFYEFLLANSTYALRVSYYSVQNLGPRILVEVASQRVDGNSARTDDDGLFSKYARTPVGSS
ncbi:hypothetical protein TNCV_3865721 [Trichonephila clavipes]|nr:hypothetical protein TNCV_3865721 [Trichonephila clavipes]